MPRITSYRKARDRDFFMFKNLIHILDVDPRRDDDASPMSSHRCMLRPT